MRLFVGSYAGTISTLELYQNASGEYSVDLVHSTRVCSPTPSWITLDFDHRLIYCTEGGRETATGTLYSLRIQPDGSLVELGKVLVPIGAAHSAIYDGGNALGVAYYHGSRVATYDTTDPYNIKPVQVLSHPLPNPGPNPVQTKSLPHQILFDPTGKHMLIPDLGADLIRIYQISANPDHQNEIEGETTLRLSAGSMPRHAVFVRAQGKTYLYVVEQNANKLASFHVRYLSDGTLGFDELERIDLLPHKTVDPDDDGIKTSELVVSPDERFLIVSIRNDASFPTIPHPLRPYEETTGIPSDSFRTYAVDPASGTLSLVQAWPAGGRVPRHFSINRRGDMVAAGLQKEGWVCVLQRDVQSGRLGNVVAARDGLGEDGVVCVLWDE